MLDADLVLIHGFWSSPGTWDRLTTRLGSDPELAGLRIHTFGYESPRLPRLAFSPARIPDYNDIAESLPAYLAAHASGDSPIVFVTHSQGGLILQRFLAWMLTEGRARELGRVRAIVMLSCPNEGSEYLASIRAVTGFNRHPQAGQLDVLEREVGSARRTVLRQIVHATAMDDRQCPIPMYVYSGRTDNVVLRQSAQSAFPSAEVLPGDHFSILDPDAPGNLTLPMLKRHILQAAIATTDTGPGPTGEHDRTVHPTPAPATSTDRTESLDPDGKSQAPGNAKYAIDLAGATNILIGDSGRQTNFYRPGYDRGQEDVGARPDPMANAGLHREASHAAPAPSEVMPGTDAALTRDFFVSYQQADISWAQWIAWHLEAAGYTVLLQAWDFVPGTNWVRLMQDGVSRCRRIIVVLSPAYIATSVFGAAEWQAVWAQDPDGAQRRVIPVRVADCERPGLLAGIVGVDVFDTTEPRAVRRLRQAIDQTLAGRAKPTTPPGFPGSVPNPAEGATRPTAPATTDATLATTAPPTFPGQKYNVKLQGARGVQIGDGNTQVNHW